MSKLSKYMESSLEGCSKIEKPFLIIGTSILPIGIGALLLFHLPWIGLTLISLSMICNAASAVLFAIQAD